MSDLFLDLCGGLRGALKHEFKFTYKGVTIRVVQACYADVEVQALCKIIRDFKFSLVNVGEKPYETPLRNEATK